MDNELFLQLGSGFGAASALFTWPKLYAQAVSTRLKTKGIRVRRWNRLLEKGRWRTALPIVLEEAFAEAHGFSLSDRDIRFALGRSNTRSLLRELRHCKGLIRLDDELKSYVSVRERVWLSFRYKSILSFILGYVPLAALFIFAPFISARANAEAQIILLILTFLVMVFGVFAASWLEAADRVVSGLDRRYPAWLGETLSGCNDVPSPALVSAVPIVVSSAA